MKGCYRFLEKTWKLVSGSGSARESGQEIINALHKLNKKVDEDLESAKFNTIIAAFMEFINLCQENKEKVGRDVAERFLVLLSPFAPHTAEELWQELGHEESIFQQKWPEAEAEFLKEESITLIIQVNGRVRDKVAVRADVLEKEAKELAISREKVKNWISGKKIKKIIFVPGRLINIVI